MNMYEFDAIGTHWWIEILDNHAITPDLRRQITAIYEQFDAAYSRFREDSLVAKLARDGNLANPPGEMLAMLDFAREMYDASEGAFNITVGATLHALGYGSRQHAGRSLANPWDAVAYSKDEISAPRGLMLDFGGFGKGWLIDLFAKELRELGYEQFIVNGGGDLYVTSRTPVEFALEDPYDPTKKIGQTRISKGALAGSNTVKRVWTTEGTQHHHIIDPTTNASSKTDIVAAYVRADTALIADTMATILILRPQLEKALAAKYNLQTILVPANSH